MTTNRRISLTLVLLGAMFATALSTPVQAADAGPISTLDCAEGATRPLPQGGVVLNNMWGRKSAGTGPWRQCLQSRSVGGKVELGWAWNWPNKDGLYAYPEVLLGRSPWQPGPTNDPRFPRRIADTPAMPIQFEVDSEFGGKKNLAAEFWLTEDNWPEGAFGAGQIRAELMIWSDYSKGMVAKDKPIATVEIDGVKWFVSVHEGWGADVGVQRAKWTFLVYRTTTPSSTGHYDARKFFQDAIDRGYVKPDWWVSTVELGNEITSGTGSTWIKEFKVGVGK